VSRCIFFESAFFESFVLRFLALCQAVRVLVLNKYCSCMRLVVATWFDAVHDG
jgi:hypothetical protein